MRERLRSRRNIPVSVVTYVSVWLQADGRGDVGRDVPRRRQDVAEGSDDLGAVPSAMINGERHGFYPIQEEL